MNGGNGKFEIINDSTLKIQFFKTFKTTAEVTIIYNIIVDELKKRNLKLLCDRDIYINLISGKNTGEQQTWSVLPIDRI